MINRCEYCDGVHQSINEIDKLLHHILHVVLCVSV